QQSQMHDVERICEIRGKGGARQVELVAERWDAPGPILAVVLEMIPEIRKLQAQRDGSVLIYINLAAGLAQISLIFLRVFRRIIDSQQHIRNGVEVESDCYPAASPGSIAFRRRDLRRATASDLRSSAQSARIR